MPFQWIDLTSDEQARAEAQVSGLDDQRLPVCEFPDGTRIERATVRQVLEKLGWYKNPSREEYDLAIYGAGPAGLSAAVYGASEGLKTVVIERYAVGGQAGSSPKIENYLGFPEGISGADLAERAREQACRFGAEILVARAGIRGEIVAGKGIGYLDDGTKIIARASVCATGVDYRKLGLPMRTRLLEPVGLVAARAPVQRIARADRGREGKPAKPARKPAAAKAKAPKRRNRRRRRGLRPRKARPPRGSQRRPPSGRLEAGRSYPPDAKSAGQPGHAETGIGRPSLVE